MNKITEKELQGLNGWFYVALVFLTTFIFLSGYYVRGFVSPATPVSAEKQTPVAASLIDVDKLNKTLDYLVSKLSDKDWCRYQVEVLGFTYGPTDTFGPWYHNQLVYSFRKANDNGGGLEFLDNSEATGGINCTHWLLKTPGTPEHYTYE